MSLTTMRSRLSTQARSTPSATVLLVLPTVSSAPSPRRLLHGPQLLCLRSRLSPSRSTSLCLRCPRSPLRRLTTTAQSTPVFSFLLLRSRQPLSPEFLNRLSPRISSLPALPHRPAATHRYRCRPQPMLRPRSLPLLPEPLLSLLA